MTQAVQMTRVEENIYRFIGEEGPVTPGELAAFLGVEDFPADIWLRSQEATGFLYRHESGAYGTSCPWPRPSF